MRTIESIACRTGDPELRERLLRELQSLQDRLSLALTIASSAKLSMQETGGEAVKHDLTDR